MITDIIATNRTCLRHKLYAARLVEDWSLTHCAYAIIDLIEAGDLHKDGWLGEQLD